MIGDTSPTDEESPIGVIYQLVAVLPPQSADLIPMPYRRLIQPGGDLSDMYPFKVIAEGVGLEWVVFLPPFNYDRVVEAVDSFGLERPLPGKVISLPQLPFGLNALTPPPRGGGTRGRGGRSRGSPSQGRGRVGRGPDSQSW